MMRNIKTLSYLAMKALWKKRGTHLMWVILRDDAKRRGVSRAVILEEMLGKVDSRGRSMTTSHVFWDTRFVDMVGDMLTIRTDILPSMIKPIGDYWCEIHVPCHVFEELAHTEEKYPLRGSGSVTGREFVGCMKAERCGGDDIMVMIGLNAKFCMESWFECYFTLSALHQWMEFRKCMDTLDKD
jgi:hypothetical protein